MSQISRFVFSFDKMAKAIVWIVKIVVNCQNCKKCKMVRIVRICQNYSDRQNLSKPSKIVVKGGSRSCVFSTLNKSLDRSQSLFRKRDWYGDHAEAGKIWEDQIFAMEAGLCTPKCTQMDESICQGFRNSWRKWFSLIFQVVAAGFLKVIFQFEEFNEECTKQDCPYT